MDEQCKEECCTGGNTLGPYKRTMSDKLRTMLYKVEPYLNTMVSILAILALIKFLGMTI